MATHSSILSWEIPWTEDPGRLQSMGLQRVEHDLGTKQRMLLIPPFPHLFNELCISFPECAVEEGGQDTVSDPELLKV